MHGYFSLDLPIDPLSLYKDQPIGDRKSERIDAGIYNTRRNTVKCGLLRPFQYFQNQQLIQ